MKVTRVFTRRLPICESLPQFWRSVRVDAVGVLIAREMVVDFLQVLILVYPGNGILVYPGNGILVYPGNGIWCTPVMVFGVPR